MQKKELPFNCPEIRFTLIFIQKKIETTGNISVLDEDDKKYLLKTIDHLHSTSGCPDYCYILITFLPKEYTTKYLWKLYLQCNGRFKDVPQEYRDEEMIDLALTGNYHNLGIVDKKYLTKEKCHAAIKKDPKAIYYVPEEFKIPLTIKQFTKNPRLIRYVLHDSITPEMCEIVAESCPDYFKHVPFEYQTEELWLRAIKNYDPAIKYVPKSFLTKDFYRKVDEANKILNNHK